MKKFKILITSVVFVIGLGVSFMYYTADTSININNDNNQSESIKNNGENVDKTPVNPIKKDDDIILPIDDTDSLDVIADLDKKEDPKISVDENGNEIINPNLEKPTYPEDVLTDPTKKPNETEKPKEPTKPKPPVEPEKPVTPPTEPEVEEPQDPVTPEPPVEPEKPVTPEKPKDPTPSKPNPGDINDEGQFYDEAFGWLTPTGGESTPASDGGGSTEVVGSMG